MGLAESTTGDAFYEDLNSRREPPPTRARGRRSVSALGRFGGGGQVLDHRGEVLDSRVDLAVLARGVAGVDALEDDRQLPVAEGDEEVELGEVAARFLCVARTQLLAARETRRRFAGWPSEIPSSPSWAQ